MRFEKIGDYFFTGILSIMLGGIVLIFVGVDILGFFVWGVSSLGIFFALQDNDGGEE